MRMPHDFEEKMPSSEELALMTLYLEKLGVALQDAGRYPLITYYGPAGGDSLAVIGDIGQHIRTTALAIHYGIPVPRWRQQLHNLNPAVSAEDQPPLSDGQWRQNWNGIWILQCHGIAGFAMMNGLKDGREFYRTHGHIILESENFSHGLIKTCHGFETALLSGGRESSFTEDILALAQRRPARLYSAQSSTWVPLSGNFAGQPMISPIVFADACKEKGYDLTRYFTCDLKTIKGFRKTDFQGLMPHLTPAFYEDAHFRPGRALPLSNRLEDSDAHIDTNWYYIE